MAFNAFDAIFIGTVLEGLFYGLYCIVFVLYIQAYTSRKRVDRNPLIYPLSTLFVLCTVYFIVDFSEEYLTIMRPHKEKALAWHLNLTASAFFSFIDFIAQGILIYRCWVVWCHQLFVIVVPSILALISLTTSLTMIVEMHFIGNVNPPSWFTPVGASSFSLSLAVNAIFTGLLVFKIAKSYLATRHLLRNAQRRNDLLPLVFMLIESGIVLFVVQLLWVISFSLELSIFYLIGGPLVMLYGIIPTIIVARVILKDACDNQTLFTQSIQLAFDCANSPTKISESTGHQQSDTLLVRFLALFSLWQVCNK